MSDQSLLSYAIRKRREAYRVERQRQVVIIYEEVKRKFKYKNPARETAKITGFSVWTVYDILRGRR